MICGKEGGRRVFLSNLEVRRRIEIKYVNGPLPHPRPDTRPPSVPPPFIITAPPSLPLFSFTVVASANISSRGEDKGSGDRGRGRRGHFLGAENGP